MDAAIGEKIARGLENAQNGNDLDLLRIVRNLTVSDDRYRYLIIRQVLPAALDNLVQHKDAARTNEISIFLSHVTTNGTNMNARVRAN